jgi:DNA-binding response OmpR family regulator
MGSWRIGSPLIVDTEYVPSVLLLAAEWQIRALLRAQLIESGFEVTATDTWPGARELLLSGGLLHLVIVDLRGLERPDSVLGELSRLMEPSRVLVLTAEATVHPGSLTGFTLLRRPVSIDSIVAAARRSVGDWRQT